MGIKKFQIAGKSYSRSQLPLSGLPSEALEFIDQYLDQEFIKVQTSGSTGKPKPIRLSTTHMRQSALKTLRFFELEPGQSCLLCMSPRYIAGMMMLVRWLEGKLNLYYSEPSSKPLKELSASIDFAAMVPYQVFHSLNDLDKLNTLLIGGGSLSPDLELQLSEVEPHVYQSYGMTETITHIALREINPNNQPLFTALPGVKFSVDQRSCLVIDAPEIGVMNLVTNDVVELYGEEEFRWNGRFDNVVNSGGIKLYPEQLEYQIGDIGCAYIFGGIPDPALGQRLVMVLESDDVPPELHDRLKELDAYHRPRDIKTIAAFDRTGTGKPRRHLILKKAFPMA